jgi:hypothetical protein
MRKNKIIPYISIVFILCVLQCCNNVKNGKILDVGHSNSCNNKSDFEQKIDTLRQTIPTVTGNQSFSFEELSQDVWNWQNSHKFIEIDSATWFDNFNKPTQLGDYRYAYTTNYYYKEFDFKDSLFNLVVLQYVHNSNESYMYLVQFDRQGNRKNTLTLASIFKSPIDYEEIYSSIQENQITTYRYYNDMDKNIVKRDTMENLW